MRRPVASCLAFGFLLVATPAPAAETTDVASSFDADNPFDFRLRVGYEYSTKTAAIKREHEGDANQQQIDVLKDLVYSQQRHTMKLRAEVGIYQDLMATVELPFVLSDSRSYSYDQRKGSECIYSGPDANCVNAGNSLTTNSSTGDPADTDPSHFIVPQGGYDATNGGMGFTGGSNLVFRSPNRGSTAGSSSDALDTINFGLTWGVLSQKRDKSKPTWIVSLEYRLSIGNIMRFDRMNAEASHGVADGLDHVVARTAVSHRFKYVDPYADFWFDYPFARRDDTLFIDWGPNAKNQLPQMSAGTKFGLELIPYDKPEKQYKIAFDVNAQISAKFDGRGYSEAWELFASSPALACDPAWNPSCSPMSIDPNTKMPWNGTTPYQNRPYSGLTTIENYAILGAQLALNIQASKWARFRAYFNYQHDQKHFITVDDVGKPAGNDSRVAAPGEYNPAFRPIINEIGRRYQVDDVDMYTLGIWAQAMF